MLIGFLMVVLAAKAPVVQRVTSDSRELVFEFSSPDGAQLSELVVVPIDGDVSGWELIAEDSVVTPDKSQQTHVEAPIEILDRMQFRAVDFRVVKINPVRLSKGKKVTYTKGRVVLHFHGSRFLRRRTESVDLMPLYESVFLNGDVVLQRIERWVRGGYLIVTHDSLASVLEPLVRWKRRLGYSVRVVRLSEISNNPTAEQIKDFVRQVYRSWSVPLTYLLLVGDNTMLYGQMPTFSYHDATDDAFYGMLVGNDYLPEVMVGRMAVDNTMELQTAIAKVIAYESDPMRGGSDWLNRALMIAGVYVHGSDTVNTTKLTKLRIMDDLQAMGMQVDTVFWNITHGGTFSDIVSSINQGVAVVNYRGWSNSTGWVYPQFYRDHIQMLNNGWKLPVMFSISCGTGNFASTTDPSFGEAWIRAGNPSNPKGGPAFLGPSDPFTHTKWNNAIDAGIFDALYHRGVTAFRPAAVAGLMNLIRSFPDYSAPGMEVEFYFHVYTVLGDPALGVWTRLPNPIVAQTTGFEPHVGSNAVTVSFNADTAVISIMLGDSLLVSSVEFDGEATLNYEIPAVASTEWVYITVSAPDRIPFVDSMQVDVARGITIASAQWDEQQGNGDGLINPDETFSLSLRLRNMGLSALTNPIVSVSTPDPELAEVIQGQSQYSGTVEPQGEFTVSGFQIHFADSVTDMLPVRFSVAVGDGGDSVFGGFDAIVYAPVLSVSAIEFNDSNGNGYLDPGENVELNLTVKNNGHETAEHGQVCLGEHPLYASNSPCVQLGALAVGDSQSVVIPMAINANAVPGRTGMLHVELRCDHFSGLWEHWIAVGALDSTAVVGPDCHGYWLYEPEVDANIPGDALFPINSWMEISSLPGAVEVQFDPAGLAVVNLPDGLTIDFYGESFDRITIARYGWIAMDSTDLYYYRNWPIPSPSMPDYLIAPFWDHLVDGHVYYYHDTANGLFIVEWKDMREFSHPEVTQKFEAIFRPEASTGHDPIMFIYNQIADVDSSENFATIGIGSRIDDCGLLYKFANRYASALVGELHNGKRLIFAAVPPDSLNYGIDEGDDVRGGLVHAILRGDMLEVKGLSSAERFRIYDIDGRVVMQGDVSADTPVIDISQLRAGVYILKVGETGAKFVRIK